MKKFLYPGPVFEEYPEIPDIFKENFAHHRTKPYQDLYFKVKKIFHDRYKAKQTYFLIGTGTTAIEAVIKSLPKTFKRAGIYVRGFFGKRALKLMINRFPLNLHIVSEGLDEFVDPEILQKAFKDCDVIYFVDVETSTGKKLNLELIRELFPDKTLIFDGISSLFVYPIEIKENEIWIASTSKGLGLTAFGAFVLTGRDDIKWYNPNSVYLDLAFYESNFEHGEPPFTSSFSLLTIVLKVLEKIDEKDKIKKIQEVSNKLVKTLNDKEYKIYPIKDRADNVILFEPKNIDKLRQALIENDFYLSEGQAELKGKVLRTGIYSYQQAKWAEELIEFLKEFKD